MGSRAESHRLAQAAKFAPDGGAFEAANALCPAREVKLHQAVAEAAPVRYSQQMGERSIELEPPRTRAVSFAHAADHDRSSHQGAKGSSDGSRASLFAGSNRQTGGSRRPAVLAI